MTTQNIAAAPAAVPSNNTAENQNPDSSAPTKGPASGSLYVGDLAPDVSEALLFEIFNPVGPVSSIRVCRDSATRQSLGYAYVNFHSAEHAELALDTLNFCPIKGNPCRIMWSHRDPAIRKSSSSNIFIKNLDKTIDNKELFDTFSQFGNILSCKVATDVTGASKGYAFVHYSDDAAASKAIEEVNGKIIKGKKVYAGKHERRQERQGAGGVGGSSFTNLYVKNVPENWNLEKFQSVFSAFGKITSSFLKIEEDGKHKGFGFVDYENHDDALKAIEEGCKISVGDDKQLFVGRFQKKAERVASLMKKFEDQRREKNEKYKTLNLYIKNLEEDIDEAKLRELFEPFGEITSCVVMNDDKGVSRGFGFVCYTNPEDATKALNEMNSKMIGQKPIYVNRAQRKEDRRAQLENQFQASLANQRMQPMPMFYPPQAGMPMGAPMMGYPHMMNRRPTGPFNPQMRNGFPPQPMYPQQNRARNGPGPRPYAGQRPGGPQQPKMRPNNGPRGYPQQPMPIPVAHPAATQNPMMNSELTASALAEASPENRKQMLGECLFPLVHREQPELAGKITGMLLEMDVSEILGVIENKADLKRKIDEAVEVLNYHQEPQA